MLRSGISSRNAHPRERQVAEGVGRMPDGNSANRSRCEPAVQHAVSYRREEVVTSTREGGGQLASSFLLSRVRTSRKIFRRPALGYLLRVPQAIMPFVENGRKTYLARWTKYRRQVTGSAVHPRRLLSQNPQLDIPVSANEQDADI